MKRLLLLSALFAAALLLMAGCGSASVTVQESSGTAAASIAAYPETMHLSTDGQDTIQVSGAETRDLIWASSDRSVAIVDESGKVTAQGPGNCTITIASRTDSNVSCHVEVVVEAPVQTQTPAQQTASVQQQTPPNNDAQVIYYVTDSDPSAEVNAMDAEETQFVINQIYAKNGYIFRTDALQAYFGQMPWYHPVSNDASQLSMSSLDRNNLALLVQHRDGMSNRASGLGYLWTYNAVSSPLSASYVRNLSKSDVQLLINTIYAKNGYIFETDELQRLFNTQGWYRGTTRSMEAVSNSFTSTDRQNINLLLQYR